MYHNFHQLWQGLSRLGAGALRLAEAGSWVMVLSVALAITPLLPGLLLVGAGLDPAWVLAAWLVVAAGYLPWARRMGPGRAALLAPAGALLVQAAGTWGLLRKLFGRGFIWKERHVSRGLSKG